MHRYLRETLPGNKGTKLGPGIAKMKLRIVNYKLAYSVFEVLKTVGKKLGCKTFIFDNVSGIDYHGDIIDDYYLIQIR